MVYGIMANICLNDSGISSLAANCNLAIFVLVALHANVVNIPLSRSQCLTVITVFGLLRLRHVNDSVAKIFPEASGLRQDTYVSIS